MREKKLERILYLEDDITLQQIVNVSLGQVGGYEIKICDSGKNLLEIAKEFNPNLFLLDIMLPDMSGPSVLGELRKNPDYADTPAIFISAKFIGHELASYRKLGVSAIIRKPFDPILLPKIIQAIYEENMDVLSEFDDRSFRLL